MQVRGKVVQVEVKLIIICEVLFGKVTFMTIMLNLTAVHTERRGFSSR